MRNLKTVKFENYITDVKDDKFRVAICASGYESRSRHWASTINKIKLTPKFKYVVIGFTDNKNALSRPINDQFYRSLTDPHILLDSNDSDSFKKELTNLVIELRTKTSKSLEIHVDYSCMPRNWYCEIPTLLEGILSINDTVYMWYTIGKYPVTDYPTAGIQDFHKFSGRSSLEPKTRTHLFGLGFDRIRSLAILTVAEPKYLVCYYADSEHTEKVEQSNATLLKTSNEIYRLPLFDFAYCYSKLLDVVREYSYDGDVILIPDGPKPLILASSLIPTRFDKNGIVCLHVRRRRTASSNIIEVHPLDDKMPIGLTFSGKMS